MEVLRRVFILGGIAATDVAAVHAQPEMHPLVARFQTLFAAMRVRNDFLDLGEVCTLAHTTNVHPKVDLLLVGIGLRTCCGRSGCLR